MFSRLTDTYFFTATINSWRNLLLEDKIKEIIIKSLHYCTITNRILLHGFVVMPNHIHLLMTLNSNQTVQIFQRDFLKYNAQQIIKTLIVNEQKDILIKYASSQKDRLYHIWERRAKWIAINNYKIFTQKLNYIHHNPTQPHWQLAINPIDYKWSSAYFYETGFDQFGMLKEL